MSRGWRVVASLALLVGVSVVPLESAAACDCSMTELGQAISEAEVAFVGTLVGSAEPAPLPAEGMGLPDPIEHAWSVERSRDALDASQLSIFAWRDDGANCGISFAAGDRWLVLAYLSEGRLETNGCMRNTLLSGAGPDEIELIDSLVATPVESTAAPPGLALPVPLLVGIGALLVVGAVSLIAFRRGGPEPG